MGPLLVDDGQTRRQRGDDISVLNLETGVVEDVRFLSEHGGGNG